MLFSNEKAFFSNERYQIMLEKNQIMLEKNIQKKSSKNYSSGNIFSLSPFSVRGVSLMNVWIGGGIENHANLKK